MNRAFESVIRDIRASNFARLEFLIFNIVRAEVPSRPVHLFDSIRNRERPNRLAFEVYQRLDRRRVKLKNDPLTMEDCSTLLDGLESIEVRRAIGREDFAEETLREIRAARLDVILHFGSDALEGDVLSAAQYGVWSFRYGDGVRFSGQPAGFWEMLEESPVSEVLLERLTAIPEPRCVLFKAAFATDFGSLSRNRAQPRFSSTHMVIQGLWQLHAWGWDRLEARCARLVRSDSPSIDRFPTNWEVVRWMTRQSTRKLASRIARLVSRRDDVLHWRIAIRRDHPELVLHGPPDMSGFRWIEAPKGHSYADPFLARRAGRLWLFFEDLRYAEGRAVIACAEVSPAGHLGSPQQVLLSEGHLSYPCVFSDGKDDYMVPESADDGSVRLYRATDFPHRWELEAELFAGKAVDTTVWEDEGRWWFFTTLHEPRARGMNLMLFHADTPGGPWIPHPMNPISVDVRNARGAGGIFRQNGKLLRPSQDCSRGYGYGFSLNEILILSPTDYAEQPVLAVSPGWDPELLGTHTYNRCRGTEVTDGKVRRPRSTVE